MSLAVALSACSTIKLGYGSLPELSYWWLDGLVDFDEQQRTRVREDIARAHAWHRSDELPRYVVLLQQLERMAMSDVSPAQACALEPVLRERFVAVRERLEPAIAGNAIGLAPAQLAHLERKFAERNREYEKDWLRPGPAERLDKRLKELVGRAETMYGSVDDGQRAALRQQLQASPFDPALALKERQRRQRDTLAVLRRLAEPGLPLDDARAAVRGLLDRAVASPDPAYRAYGDALRQEACQVAASLHNSMSPAQREQAVRRLRGWQRDLAELAAAR